MRKAGNVSGRGFLYYQMGLAVAAGEDAEAQNFRDHAGGVAGAIDAMVGELIRGQALGVEGAKTLFVAEERAAGHGHAAGEEEIGGRVEPEYGNASRAEEFRAAGLRVGAAAESEDGAGFVFGGAAERGAKLVGFQLAKGGFAKPREEFCNGDVRCGFDALVEVNEAPSELAREERADGGFARTHKSREA